MLHHCPGHSLGKSNALSRHANDAKWTAWEMINTLDGEEDLSGSPPTMEAKQLHWSMLEAKAGQMHMCILHKQQENAKEILCIRHGRESIGQEPSPIEVIHMTWLHTMKGLTWEKQT